MRDYTIYFKYLTVTELAESLTVDLGPISVLAGAGGGAVSGTVGNGVLAGVNGWGSYITNQH